jgi:hypothetical protein
MHPTDDWLELLNFYLIVNSGGALTLDHFDNARLDQAYQENPGERFADMNATAVKLVLEFEAQKPDTEIKTSLNGITHVAPLAGEEIPTNGPLSILLPHLPDHL